MFSINKNQEITKFVSYSECSGLNIEGDGNVSGLFGNGVPVKSNEGDPEIIINVKFKVKVNITHILIESSMDKNSAPEKVKIFTNSSNLDFADAEENPATETIKLNDENLGKKISVKIPKFKNVSELCLFFINEELDYIKINSIRFYGSLGEVNIDFGEMKKNPVTWGRGKC